jgi:L-amino acid N-acyltransferase YncA
VFLAYDEMGSPCGFAACGRQRSPRLVEAGFPVEFSTLYLLRRAQRRGLGRAMMSAMAKHLIAEGYSKASAWVFRDSPPARRFHERLGGERTGIDGEWTVLGVTLPDISYGWRDLSKLAAHQ